MRSVLQKRTVMLGVVLVLVSASLLGGHILAGSAPATTRQPAPIWLGTAGTTTSGRSLFVEGGIGVKADLGGTVVKLYKRDAGQNTNTLVAKATVNYSMMTGNLFHATLPRLRRSCIVTAVWGGNTRYFGSRTWMFAGVKPRLTVTAPLATQAETKLRIAIAPVQPSHGTGMTRPGFLADIQCLVDGAWTYFPGELGVASTDGESWCVYRYFNVPAGTYTVRANFKGTNYNCAAVSKSVQVTVP
jgi:hypothetical protein